jgi:pentatricopeptide repeat protein
MIDEYCLVAKMEKAFRVVDTMVSDGMSPSVITHHLVLSMLMLSLS